MARRRRPRRPVRVIETDYHLKARLTGGLFVVDQARECQVSDRAARLGMVARAMSNAISHLKARYCRSIMNTASISPDAEARRLIDGLTTELLTKDASPAVAAAEQAAHACVSVLADRLISTTMSGAALEWARTRKAVLHWIDVSH